MGRERMTERQLDREKGRQRWGGMCYTDRALSIRGQQHSGNATTSPTPVMSVISHTITSLQSPATLNCAHIHMFTHHNGYSLDQWRETTVKLLSAAYLIASRVQLSIMTFHPNFYGINNWRKPDPSRRLTLQWWHNDRKTIRETGLIPTNQPVTMGGLICLGQGAPTSLVLFIL